MSKCGPNSLASFFGKPPNDGAVLHAVLLYILHAMTTVEAMSEAANAFRNLCARCKQQLCAADVLGSLLQAAEQAVAPGHLGSNPCRTAPHHKRL